jgi:5,10-methenyltetrahydrofolate synthetase
MSGERDEDDDTRTGEFASPPCFMHELDPTYLGMPFDARQWRDVMRWRKAARQRLIAARLALSAAERTEHSRAVERDLRALLSLAPSAILSIYWPFRGEPDLRDWMSAMSALGVRIALPVVVAKQQPLVFREWRPGARMERGVWNIPVPAEGAEVVPSVVIAPLVGFDVAGYRLGYGGGYYDRTLAALAPRPLAIGVGHPYGALATTYPQPHDVPMDWIVTGDGTPQRRERERPA